MKYRVWALVLGLALLTPANAPADQTTLGLALTGTHGTHREPGGTAKAPLIPAPVIAVSHRFKRFEIVAEGLPPLGAIPVTNNGLGMKNIALSYGDATLRYWNKRGTFAVGFGETLYNQRTTFTDYQDPTVQLDTIDASRIAGTRYEVLSRFSLPGRNYVEAQLALNPSLHGRYSFEHDAVTSGAPAFSFTSVPEGERACEVDAMVRFVHPFGPFALSYGLHYLNYTAQFTERPWQPFADANSFVMPFVALQRSWGR